MSDSKKLAGKNVKFSVEKMHAFIINKGFKLAHFEEKGISKSTVSTALSRGSCRSDLLEKMCDILDISTAEVSVEKELLHNNWEVRIYGISEKTKDFISARIKNSFAQSGIDDNNYKITVRNISNTKAFSLKLDDTDSELADPFNKILSILEEIRETLQASVRLIGYSFGSIILHIESSIEDYSKLLELISEGHITHISGLLVLGISEYVEAKEIYVTEENDDLFDKDYISNFLTSEVYKNIALFNKDESELTRAEAAKKNTMILSAKTLMIIGASAITLYLFNKLCKLDFQQHTKITDNEKINLKKTTINAIKNLYYLDNENNNKALIELEKTNEKLKNEIDRMAA